MVAPLQEQLLEYRVARALEEVIVAVIPQDRVIDDNFRKGKLKTKLLTTCS